MNKKILLTSLFFVGLTSLLESVSTPTLSRVLGDYFVPGVSDPSLGSTGSLNRTFSGDGSLSLDSELSGGQAKAIQVLSDGKFLVGLSKSGSNSVVAKYTATGVVESTANFGTSGVADLGTTAEIHTLLVDDQNRIIVAGGNDSTGTTGFLKRVSADGDTVVTFVNGSPWRFIGGIARQTSGKVIVVGHDGTHAMIARYTAGSLNTAGELDATFGASGYVIFNGTQISGLASTNGLYNIVVDANDKIYVAYLDGTTANVAKFTAAGVLDTSFDADGIAPISYLNSATASTIRLALDVNDNLVAAAQVSTNVKVTSIESSDGTDNTSFTDFVSTSIGVDERIVRSLVTTSDNKVFVIASNITDIKSNVIRLTGAGILDTDFNETGYNEFTVSAPDTSSFLYGGSIAPNGTLFVAGYQVNSGITVPYVSNLYNQLYVSQVLRSPVSSEEGTFDETFGASQTYAGVVMPFNGLYGASLQQRARAVIELASGDMLVGMDGKTNSVNNSRLMVSRLDVDGLIQAQSTLTAVQTDEYLLSLLDDASGNIYVSGYSTAGAIFRKYNSSYVQQWVGDVNTASTYKGTGIALQGTTRVLLFTQATSTTGEISAHSIADGTIDTAFGASGYINTATYSLNMGPVYGGLVNLAKNIYVAYKNSSTGAIDVAALLPDGSALISQFGSAGVVSNVFSSTSLDATQVRVAFDNNYNIVVAAVDAAGTGFVVARLDAETGDFDTDFSNDGLMALSVTGVTSLSIQKITGLSDGSLLIAATDNATDDQGLVISITSAGAIDTNFNAQGSQQGVLPIQVGDKVASYNARATTGLMVQSSTGNIIVAGYEQQTVSDAMPIVLRVFGESATTEIANSPIADQIAGTLDTSFGGDGGVDLTSLIAAGGAKVVYAYSSGTAYEGKLLVGIDLSASSTVKLARVDAVNLTLDSSFGTAGILTLSSLSGLNHITLDAQGKIIIAGTYSGNGWAKRLTADGVVDLAFDDPTNLAAISYVYQQKSGRYIVAGTDDLGDGVIVAFRDKGALSLPVDTTFNPLGATPSRRTIGTTGLYNLAINTDDTILVAYSDTTVKVTKIRADGAFVVSGFGISGITNTGITPSAASSIRLVIDSNDKVCVAATVGTTSLSIVRYTSAGGADVTFNTDGSVKTMTNVGTGSVALAHLMATNQASGEDKIIALGYNTAGGNGRMFAVRLGVNGSLDSLWNSSPAGTDTAGALTYSVESSTTMYSGSIAVNGNIYACGQGTGNKPVLMRIFGDNWIGEATQQPLEASAGTLDYTVDLAGALDLETDLTLTFGTPKKLHIYADGSQLIASNSGSTTVVTKIKANGVAETAFGTAGRVVITSATTVRDMFVANGSGDDGAIYLIGEESGAMWAAKLSSAGVQDGSFTMPNTLSMTIGAAIRPTRNGDILVAGFNGSFGIVAAYKEDGTGLNLGFGNGLGYYVTDMATAIYDMAVDSYGRAYIAYKDTTPAIKVKRLLPYLTDVDTTFATGSIAQTNALSASQIRLSLDEANAYVTVAVQDGTSADNVIKVARLSTVDGSAAGTANTVTVGSTILNLVELFTDSDLNTYVAGYVPSGTNAGKIFVARCQSTSSTTIALDATYAAASTPAGVALLTAGSMTSLGGAGMWYRKVGVVGSVGGVAYKAELFGDEYTTQTTEELGQAVPGDVDTTLDANDVSPEGGIDLSALTGWSSLSSYTAKAVYTNADGTSFIAFGDGADMILGKVDADMNPVTVFSADGITAAVAMATINSLMVDVDGKIVVCGTNQGAQKVVRYTTVGAVDVTFSTGLSVTVGTTVAQQKSGRYVVGSKIGSAGVVNAYQNTGASVDATFGPSTLNGYYSTGVNAQIDDLVVDSNDNIYIVYRNTNLYLEKITANGSGKVAAFGSGVAVNTGIVATSTAYIAINSAGNILVGAKTAAGVKTRLYNGTTGAAIAAALSVTATATDVLTKLVGTSNAFVGSIYTTTPTAIAFRINAAGALDTGFSTDGVAFATSESVTQVWGTSLQPDGKIILVGKSATVPVLVRFYGYPDVPGYAQMPDKGDAGVLDTTLSPSTGVLNLDDALSIVDDLNGYAVKRVHEYSNGKMLFVADNGTNTIVFKLLKDLTLDTSFSSDGSLTIASYASPKGLYVDEEGNIFVAGGTSTSWVRAYNSDGTALTGWVTPTSNLANGAFEISEQSCQRVILAGKGSTNGMLYGYTNGGILDTEFGTAGVVDMGTTPAIADMVIDNLDRIITVHSNAGTSVLNRVSAEGDTITNLYTLGSGTAITGITGNELKVVQDNDGNIIVAAATSAGFRLRRYTSGGVDDASGLQTVAVGGTAHLGNIYVTSDDKVVLVGYDDDTIDKIVVVRLDSAFALDSSFGTNGVLSTAAGSMNLVYDGTIHADNRIMVVGGSSSAADPLMVRVFGDDYVTIVPQSPTKGVAGVLDATFAASGAFTLSTLGAGALDASQGKAIITLADGGHYIALDNGSNTKLIRTTAENALNTAFSTDGIGSDSPTGVFSMMQDGLNRLVLVGSASGTGWIRRYANDDSGNLDTTFDTDGAVSFVHAIATVAVEQTNARLVVAGKNTNGVLRAYTNSGALDTTFNWDGATPGEFDTGVASGIYALVCDQYDRLIIAYKDASTVKVARLVSSGELDTTFGTGGIVTAIAAHADLETDVRLALNNAGNIVLAAHINDGANKISVISIDNLSAASGNGAVVNAVYNISGLTAPVLKDLVATDNNYVFVLGTQSGTNNMWVARLTLSGSSAAALDTAGFNPAAIGGTAGIFRYAGSGDTSPAHVYNAMAVRQDGRLSIVGYEDIATVDTPVIIRVYNEPYKEEEAQSPNAADIGTNNITLGLTSYDNGGITFYASSGGSAQLQVARAVAMQDDNSIVVAIDGQSTANTENRIFINMFNIDGTLDTNFDTDGKSAVTHTYQNEYVRSMMTFTADSVNYAVLAGYATNSTLSVTNSLLMQYNLTTPGLDSAFGGYDGDVAGVAFGDGKQAQVVNRQSNGRLVVTGLDQSDNGLLLGYTSTGKLDKSFGTDGYQTQGATGIYTSAIDANDRIFIAYNVENKVAVACFLPDGSALDTSFSTDGIVDIADRIGTISGNSNIRLAIAADGKIVVAAVINSGTDVMIKRYTTSGAVDVSLTVASATLGTLTDFTLAKLLVDTAGKVICVGYDNAGSDKAVVFRALANLTALDSTFNPNGTPGYLKYAVASGTTQVITDALILPDGRIHVVGSEA